MPTIEQIRAARALIGWSQKDLADHADLSQTGVARIENGTNQPNSSTIAKIRAAFDKADIEFLDSSGVKKRIAEVKTLSGAEGFRRFMDDVYETAKNEGGEIILHSANPENWHKWMGKEAYDAHAKRMHDLGDKINVKITVEEGNRMFIAGAFAEYRWFTQNIFHEQSFYAYGSKLAFISFSDTDVQIQILDKKEFSHGFRVLFNIAWENFAIVPPKE